MLALDDCETDVKSWSDLQRELAEVESRREALRERLTETDQRYADLMTRMIRFGLNRGVIR